MHFFLLLKREILTVQHYRQEMSRSYRVVISALLAELLTASVDLGNIESFQRKQLKTCGEWPRMENAQ